jgi:hypothetical protein
MLAPRIALALPAMLACAASRVGNQREEELALAATWAAKPYPVLPEGADCLRGTVLRAVFRNPKR